MKLIVSLTFLDFFNNCSRRLNIGLSEKIINLRKSNNLSQEELAKRLFVSRQAISKYERGVCFPSIDTIKLISKEFNISINDLLDVNKKINP